VLKLLCVDPHPLVVAGLAAVVADDPILELAGSVSDARSAPEAVRRLHPDVVVMDPAALGTDGFALCRRLKDIDPSLRVVFHTALGGSPGMALAARVAGAEGLLDKTTAPAQLLASLRAIGTGLVALPPLGAAEFEAAARRVEPDDLALLAMLADRTPAADAADTLRLDRRGVARRIERMLPRLAGLRAHPA
jgi:DNA-binding NarL/FixJ family response regulator